MCYSSDEQRKKTLEDLSKVVGRSLRLLFDDMMLLMSQCDSLDSRLINRMVMALTPKPETTINNSITTTQSSVFSGIFPGNFFFFGLYSTKIIYIRYPSIVFSSQKTKMKKKTKEK